MDRVSLLLPSVLRKRGLFDQVSASSVSYTARAWIAQHAPGLAPFIQVKSLTQGVLQVEATHHMALVQAHELSQDLLGDLQKQFPNVCILRISVVRSRIVESI